MHRTQAAALGVLALLCAFPARPDEPLPPLPPVPAETAAPPAASPAHAAQLTLLAGAIVPRTGMDANYALGVEGAWRLPWAPAEWLRDRLQVTLGLGYALLRQTSPEIVVGRGYDTVIQNSYLLPIDLGVRARLLRFGPQIELSAGLGYELVIAWTRYLAFGTETRNNDAISGASIHARLDWPLGPGALVAELRHAELAKTIGYSQPGTNHIGEPRLSGTRISAGYSFAFF
jgi:hypothetical protein